MARFQLFKKHFVFVVSACLFTTLAFQNCSQKKFSSQASTDIEKEVFNPLAVPIVIQKSMPTLITTGNYIFEFEIQGATADQLQPLQCQINQKAMAPCTSPTSFALTGLVDGDQIVKIKATTKAGVVVEKSFQFRKDTVAPAIAVQVYPATVTTSLSETIEFTAQDAVAGVRQIECSFNNEPFKVCTSPQVLNNLAIGDQTFRLRATDFAGNVSVVRSVGWTINAAAAPTFEISQKPDAFVNVDRAQFYFNGSTITKYECKVDSGNFSECSSSFSHVTTEGAHKLEVRGQNSQGVWSDTKIIEWFFDNTKPSKPVLTHSILPKSKDEHPQIAFLSQDAGSGLKKYECQVNGAPYKDCTSPMILSDLRQGPNSFNVRAVDRANNNSEDALIDWTLDSQAPTTPMIRINQMPPYYEFTNSFSVESMDMGGTGNSAVHYVCTVNSQPVASCGQNNIIQTPTVGDYVIEAIAIDEAGNVSEKSTVTLIREEAPAFIKLQVCGSMVKKPVIVGSTAIMAQSGQAFGVQYKSTSPLLTDITIFPDPTDPVRFSQWGCKSVLGYKLRCEIVTGNPASPVIVRHALNEFGVDLLNGNAENSDIILQEQIAGNSFDRTACEATFIADQVTSKFNFKLKFPNETSGLPGQKCVDAQYTLKISARLSETAGGTSQLSEPAYYPVSIRNKCWDEVSAPAFTGYTPVQNPNSRLGQEVQISNQTAAALAPDEASMNNPTIRSAVYIYDSDGYHWQQSAKIMNTSQMERFVSISLDTHTLIIGVEYLSGQPGGAVLRYSRTDGNQWILSERFENPSETFFGRKVKMLNFDTLAIFSKIGFHTYKINPQTGIDSASDRVYNLSTTSNTYFSIDNDATGLIVGVYDLGSMADSLVYIYEMTSGGLIFRRMLTGPSSERFGQSVAIRARSVAIGSPSYSGTSTLTNQGKVDFYSDYMTINPTTTQVLKGKTGYQNFGVSLLMNYPGELFVGAPSDMGPGSERVYFYSGLSSGSSTIFELFPQSGMQPMRSRFGMSISGNNSFLAVGAPGFSTTAPDGGNIFIYKIRN